MIEPKPMLQDALTWSSMVYGLNPHLRDEGDHRVSSLDGGWVGGPTRLIFIYYKFISSYLHESRRSDEAWAGVESGVVRAFAGYCMTRFQRTTKTRWLSSILCLMMLCELIESY